MLRTLLCALLSLALAVSVAAQTEPSKRFPETNVNPSLDRPSIPTGGSRPRVTADVRLGERAPEFELEDATGAKVKLRSLRGQWVALFFVSRREGLEPLADVQRDLESHGVRVVAICAEKTNSLKRFVSEHPTRVMALSDPMSDVACLYGLYDNTRNQSLPGLVLINFEGEVRLALMGQELPAPDATRIVQFAVTGL